MLVIHQCSSLPRGTNARDFSRQYLVQNSTCALSVNDNLYLISKI